jgi:AcrR family transcriptional regulator
VKQICFISATDNVQAVPVEIEDQLLDAAARVMDRDGLAGLSISAIAEEAGLSRVTLHRRGARLDDYLIAVLGRASDDLRASLWPVLTSSGTAEARLREALEILCEVCERHTGVMTAMYSTPARPLPDEPGRTTSMEFIEPFERLLRDGRLDGSLVCDDPVPEATLVANAVAWTYLHMRQAHRWDAETASTRVVRLAIAHLLPS